MTNSNDTHWRIKISFLTTIIFIPEQVIIAFAKLESRIYILCLQNSTNCYLDTIFRWSQNCGSIIFKPNFISILNYIFEIGEVYRCIPQNNKSAILFVYINAFKLFWFEW